jgi:hypothetical protein
MQNGRKTNVNRRHQRPAASFPARSKPWSSNASRPEPKALTTRKETMSDILNSPVLKP